MVAWHRLNTGVKGREGRSCNYLWQPFIRQTETDRLTGEEKECGTAPIPPTLHSRHTLNINFKGEKRRDVYAINENIHVRDRESWGSK